MRYEIKRRKKQAKIYRNISTPPPKTICARAMPRTKKAQQKVTILKKTTGFCPSLGVLTLMLLPVDSSQPVKVEALDMVFVPPGILTM